MAEVDTRHPTTGSSDSTAALTLRDMTPDRVERVMARLWTRMSSIYGADRWERAYGAQWAEPWAQILGHCTLGDVVRGIGVAERDTSGRLPTAGEFRGWCRQHPPGTFAGSAAPAAMPTLRQLARSTEAGRRWLALMWLDGLAPRPEGASQAEMVDALDEADVSEMRRRVRVELAALRELYGRQESAA